jgi:outer membrane immunogenic protein
MKKILLATVGILALGVASASAADLPRREAMPTKAVPYVSMYNWTGLYVGVNGGYGWSRGGFAGDADGFIGGGQIGYNWQAVGSPWVFGLEADFQGADLSNSGTIGGVTLNAETNMFGTVRGRVGYAWDRTMLYATGGYAYARNEITASAGGASISNNEWRSGYTVGGGIEHALWDRWTAKLEYLYVHTDDSTVTLAGVPFTGDNNINIVRAGLNYRF